MPRYLLQCEKGGIMELKDRLKKFRKAKGMTQKELSVLSGISVATIRKYESGERNPKSESLNKIMKALNFTIEDLTDIAGLPIPEDVKIQLNEYTLDELTVITDVIKSHFDGKTEIGIVSMKDIYGLGKVLIFLRSQDSRLISDEKALLLLKKYEKLNLAGKDKLIDQVEMLSKVPEYNK